MKHPLEVHSDVEHIIDETVAIRFAAGRVSHATDEAEAVYAADAVHLACYLRKHLPMKTLKRLRHELDIGTGSQFNH